MVDEITPPADPTPVKDGWKTSEFWIHLVLQIASMVLMFAPSGSSVQKIAGGVLSLGSYLGYTVSRTSIKNAAQVLLIGVLLLGAGCKALDAKVAKQWSDRDAKMVQILGGYVAADATKTDDQKAAEKTKFTAHLVQVSQDIRGISLDDETALMTELLAYINADAKRDADNKKAWSDDVQAHLRLFSDEIK